MNKHAHSWMIIDVYTTCTMFVAIGSLFDVIDNKGVLKWVWLGMMAYSVLIGVFRSKIRKSHAPSRLKFRGSWKELSNILIFGMNFKLESKIGDYYMFKEKHRLISNNYVQVLKIDEGFELITDSWGGWLVGSLLEYNNFEEDHSDQKYETSKAVEERPQLFN